MKISKVIPILKSCDNSILSNYRPISLLSQFSKILEKLFERRLSCFLEKNLILNNSQYGFRHYRSTLTALVNNNNGYFKCYFFSIFLFYILF